MYNASSPIVPRAMKLTGKTPAMRQHPVNIARHPMPRRPLRAVRLMATAALALAGALAAAHGFQAGDLQVRHPFATPTPPGARIGAAYFAALENQGAQADRLLRASTPVAARVELHSGDIGADGVMRMREKEAIDVPAKATVTLRPGGGDHLMLMEIKQPLVAGDRFPMTLEFERAGKVEVEVVVEVPKGGVAGHGHGPQDAGAHGAMSGAKGRGH